MVSYRSVLDTKLLAGVVLILVVMEDGLVHNNGRKNRKKWYSLNPCCNGQWSRTDAVKAINEKG